MWFITQASVVRRRRRAGAISRALQIALRHHPRCACVRVLPALSPRAFVSCVCALTLLLIFLSLPAQIAASRLFFMNRLVPKLTTLPKT